MSADNYIAMQKRGDRWHVWMASASHETPPEVAYGHRDFAYRPEADYYAHELCHTEYVEYGVRELEAV